MHTYSIETLKQRATGSDVYAQILADHMRFGALTAEQIRILNIYDPGPAQQQPALPFAPEVPTSNLEAAIEYARGKGVPQPIIRVAGFSFMPADPQRAKPENAKAIFVNTAERGGKYLGKVLHGRFMPCGITGDVHAKILRAIEDPYTAAVEYGRLTGRCSICDRTLSNEESVKLGIGPVCRAKFGWK